MCFNLISYCSLLIFLGLSSCRLFPSFLSNKNFINKFPCIYPFWASLWQFAGTEEMSFGEWNRTSRHCQIGLWTYTARYSDFRWDEIVNENIFRFGLTLIRASHFLESLLIRHLPGKINLLFMPFCAAQQGNQFGRGRRNNTASNLQRAPSNLWVKRPQAYVPGTTDGN